MRSTRWGGRAVAFDACGRVRDWLPKTEANRVGVFSVPVSQRLTPYTGNGDFVLALALHIACLLVQVGWLLTNGVPGPKRES